MLNEMAITVPDTMISADSIILKNQPVAKEGVLPYSDGKKLKRWEHLKQNAGRIVPVLDGHPSNENGNFGLFSGKEKIHGYAFLKKCSKNKRLCADIKLFDEKMMRRAYSIGYPYLEDKSPGEYEGEHYDEVQSNLIVDHVALTDHPRDPQAVKSFADSKTVVYEGVPITVAGDSVISSTVVNINTIGYDSISHFVDVDKHSTIMDIARRLREDNPDLDDDVLLEHATQMFVNQQKNGDTMPDKKDMKDNADAGMPEEEEKDQIPGEEPPEGEKSGETEMKEKMDSLEAANKALLAKLANLDAQAAHDAEIAEKDRKIAEKDAIIEKFLEKEMKADLDTLVEEHKFKSADFDGWTPAELKRGLWIAQNISKDDPQKGKPVDADADSDSKKGGLSQYERRYSHKKRKFVPLNEYDEA
jgi:hypothetical protein